MFRQINNTPTEYAEIALDGKSIPVPANISVAAALLLAGISATRTTPVANSPRAPFCMMGVCFDCLMNIDGQPNQRACMVRVRDGMQLRHQHGSAQLDADE